MNFTLIYRNLLQVLLSTPFYQRRCYESYREGSFCANT